MKYTIRDYKWYGKINIISVFGADGRQKSSIIDFMYPKNTWRKLSDDCQWWELVIVCYVLDKYPKMRKTFPGIFR